MGGMGKYVGGMCAGWVWSVGVDGTSEGLSAGEGSGEGMERRKCLDVGDVGGGEWTGGGTEGGGESEADMLDEGGCGKRD